MPILIAINPYEEIKDLYDYDRMKYYRVRMALLKG